MSKGHRKAQPAAAGSGGPGGAQPHDMGRGAIQDNALKALVTSPLFRSRTEKPKKGKGAYSRKAANAKGHQHKGYAPFDFPGLMLSPSSPAQA